MQNLTVPKLQHPTMERLKRQLAADYPELQRLSALALRLGETPSVVGNWVGRGISQSGLSKIEQRLGIRAVYLNTGNGPAKLPPGHTGGTVLKEDVEPNLQSPLAEQTLLRNLFLRLPAAERQEVLALLADRVAYYDDLFAELQQQRQQSSAF
jgi:hypothetical protein